MHPFTTLILVAIVLVTSGCATAIRGSTQRVTLVTDPPGASCSLATEGSDKVYQVAATPDSVEVGRSARPLVVSCAKSGHLDVIEPFASIPGDEADTAAQKMQFVGSGVLTGATYLGLHATVVATAAMGFGGGVVVAGAGLVAAPLLLGLIIAAPISFAVDLSTGARYGYPPAIAVLLPPSSYRDAETRDAYFDTLDHNAVAAGAEERRKIEAECSRIYCARRIREADEGVAAQRAKIALMRQWATLLPLTDPAVAQAAPPAVVTTAIPSKVVAAD